MGDTFSLDPEPARLADIAGFRTGTASCGLKSEGPDIGVLLCEEAEKLGWDTFLERLKTGDVDGRTIQSAFEGAGTAIFTRNAVRAAPVCVSRPGAVAGQLRAVVVNAGNGNCCTGEDGLRDAREVASLAASRLGVPAEQVLVASSGVVGRPLPMEQVRKGLEEACRDARETGGGDFASAMGSADTVCKLASARGTIDGKAFRVAGAAKGQSTGAPDMAPMFAFLVADAGVTPPYLREVLVSAFERTFNRVIVGDGPGTNDTLCILASARAGNRILDNVFSGGVFAEAVEAVARQLAVGGEAARRPVEVRVSGAVSDGEAELVSRAVAQSMLVRTALPDWGLILAAAGRSGARVEASRATVRLAGETLYDHGRPVGPLPAGSKEKLVAPGVTVDLGLGEGSATMWAQRPPAGGQERPEKPEAAAAEAKALATAGRKQLEAKPDG